MFDGIYIQNWQCKKLFILCAPDEGNTQTHTHRNRCGLFTKHTHNGKGLSHNFYFLKTTILVNVYLPALSLV